MISTCYSQCMLEKKNEFQENYKNFILCVLALFTTLKLFI